MILPGSICYIVIVGKSGRLAQLGERCVRNAEVGGSIPPPSTNFPLLSSRPKKLVRVCEDIPWQPTTPGPASEKTAPHSKPARTPVKRPLIMAFTRFGLAGREGSDGGASTSMAVAPLPGLLPACTFC